MPKQIEIKAPFRPFCFEAGIEVLIPSSPIKVIVYPAHLVFTSLLVSERESFSIDWHLPEIPNKSMVVQDLERRSINISVRMKTVFFSYHLFFTEKNLWIFMDRCPETGLHFTLLSPHGSQKRLLQKKERHPLFPVTTIDIQKKSEKIHFGCYKAQNWPLVRQRALLAEILPLWFFLGQDFSPLACGADRRAGQGEILFGEIAKCIDNGFADRVGSAFLRSFSLLFRGMLVPHPFDFHHFGFPRQALSSEHETISPLYVLAQGAHLIRSLFFQEEKNGTQKILPCLPKEIHSGRFVGLQSKNGVTIALEWSKKKIRRVTLEAKDPTRVHLRFFGKETSFRLRKSLQERGVKLSIHSPISMNRKEKVFLDQFQA